MNAFTDPILYIHGLCFMRKTENSAICDCSGTSFYTKGCDCQGKNLYIRIYLRTHK